MRTNSDGIRTESRLPEWCPACGHKLLFWKEVNRKIVHMRIIPCTEYDRLKALETKKED